MNTFMVIILVLMLMSVCDVWCEAKKIREILEKNEK